MVQLDKSHLIQDITQTMRGLELVRDSHILHDVIKVPLAKRFTDDMCFQILLMSF